MPSNQGSAAQLSYEQGSVVITGASRGIGADIARAFAEGTDRPLLLMARSESDLEQTAEECRAHGADVAIITCDLSDPDAIAQLVWPEVLPKPSIIIHNAGYFLLKPTRETTWEEWQLQQRLHLDAVFLLNQKWLPLMETYDRAWIAGICSQGSLQGHAQSGAYAASKHGLLGYLRSLRLELAKSHIGVTAVNLGQTMSTSWEGMEVNPDQLVDPKDVGRILVDISRLSYRTCVDEINITPQTGRIPPDGF
jgi:short-subunit dehydrogenase